MQSCSGYPRAPLPSMVEVLNHGQDMNDDRDLEGLRALVTGATSGIGRAAAQQLARQAPRSSCTAAKPAAQR